MRDEVEAKRIVGLLRDTAGARSLEMSIVRASTRGALIEQARLNEARTG